MFSKVYEFVLKLIGYNQGLRGYFFFSESGKRVYSRTSKPVTKVKLDNGKIVEYTEWSFKKKPFSAWEDNVYLGRGSVYSIGGTIQNAHRKTLDK